MTTDHLGSPRVVTDASGQVTARRDFMAFGEELGVGVGGRTEALKYSDTGTDRVRKRFTGYEKDDETGLDFAEARMYQNKHGRFTAVDPLLASASAANPQTFNRYTYTGNDPVNVTDPGGLTWCQSSDGTVTWNGARGKACAEGTVSVDGDVLQHTEGPGGIDSNGNAFGVGDLLQFNGNGTRNLIQRQREAGQIAAATGTEVRAEQEEILTTDAATISDHIASAFMTVAENNGVAQPVYYIQGREYQEHTGTGQTIGNWITLGQGAFEVLQGVTTALGGSAVTVGTLPACATGVGCAIPAATVTVSAVGIIEAAHGAGVIGLTMYNMVNNQGPGSRSGIQPNTTGSRPNKTAPVNGANGPHTTVKKDPSGGISGTET